MEKSRKHKNAVIAVSATVGALVVAGAVTAAVLLTRPKKHKAPGSVPASTISPAKPRMQTPKPIADGSYVFNAFKSTGGSFLRAGTTGLTISPTKGATTATGTATFVWQALDTKPPIVDVINKSFGQDFNMCSLGVGRLFAQFGGTDRETLLIGGAGKTMADVPGSAPLLGSADAPKALSQTLVLVGVRDPTTGARIPGTDLYVVLVDPSGSGGYFLELAPSGKASTSSALRWGQRTLTAVSAASVGIGAVGFQLS